MAILKNKNFASSLLAAGVLIGDTALTVTSAEGTKFPQTGYFMAALWGAAYPSPALDPNRELVKVTLTSGDTFSIARAQEGTTAKGWSSGDNFAAVVTAGKMDELETFVQNQLLSFGTATGTNTYTAVMDPAVTAYTTGMAVNVKFVNASTGACVLGLNALASKKIYKFDNGAYSACDSGDISAGLYTTLFYDSTLDSGGGGWLVATNKVTIPSTFPSGTTMLFAQASAPTGWTKDASLADTRSILVSATYGVGGSDAATGFTTNVTVAAHATHLHTGSNHTHTVTVNGHVLSAAELAAHSHTVGTHTGYTSTFPASSGSSLGRVTSTTSTVGSNYAHNHTGTAAASGTGNTGYAGPTTHTVGQSTYLPLYMAVIKCSKD